MKSAREGCPPPLRGIDTPGSFTYVSIAERLPRIIAQLADKLDASPDPVPSDVTEALRDLSRSIAADEPLPTLAMPFNAVHNDFVARAAAADAAACVSDEKIALSVLGGNAKAHAAALTRASWMSLPWWLTENFAYRAVLDIVRPRCGAGFDPFCWHKREATEHGLSALEADLPSMVACGDDPSPLLVRSLWGNRADLSLSAGEISSEHHSPSGTLLVHDDVAAASARLASATSVVWVLDNCGLELLADLAVVDWATRRGASVTLHCKPDPVFVSDAMPKDVESAIESLAACGPEGPALSSRLRDALARREPSGGAGCLRIVAHPYYVSPLEASDMPADVAAMWAEADLVVVKGDANYRRVTGDRHWPVTADLRRDVAPWVASPTVLLRTLKSDSLAGVTDDEARAAAEFSPEWRVSGVCGVVQLVIP